MLPTKLSKIHPDPNVDATILAKQILKRNLNTISQKLIVTKDTEQTVFKQLLLDILDAQSPINILSTYNEFKVYHRIIKNQNPQYHDIILTYIMTKKGLDIELGSVFQATVLGKDPIKYFKQTVTKIQVKQTLDKAFQIYHQIYH